MWGTWWQCRCPWCYHNTITDGTDILSQHSNKHQLNNCLLQWVNLAFKTFRLSRHLLWINWQKATHNMSHCSENPFFRTSRSVQSFHVSLLSENTWNCASEICISLLSVLDCTLVGGNQTSIVTQGRVNLIYHYTIIYATFHICLAIAKEVIAQCSVKISES